jgi:hypothetical protein
VLGFKPIIKESPTQKTSPLGGRASWLKYHIKHFYVPDVGLLTVLVAKEKKRGKEALVKHKQSLTGVKKKKSNICD